MSKEIECPMPDCSGELWCDGRLYFCKTCARMWANPELVHELLGKQSARIKELEAELDDNLDTSGRILLSIIDASYDRSVPLRTTCKACGKWVGEHAENPNDPDCWLAQGIMDAKRH